MQHAIKLELRGSMQNKHKCYKFLEMNFARQIVSNQVLLRSFNGSKTNWDTCTHSWKLSDDKKKSDRKRKGEVRIEGREIKSKKNDRKEKVGVTKNDMKENTRK